MRLIALLIAGTLVASVADAQERWRQLSGAASTFAVDLQSLALESGVLRARVQTPDQGTLIQVEELEVRCSAEQLRTVAQYRYDRDTGRPVPDASQDRNQQDAPWVGFTPGSQGHALLSSLCRLARDRKLVGTDEHSKA
jgi:surface-adhesin protein E